MTPLEPKPSQPLNPLEEQQVITQQAQSPPSLQTAMILINMGIQKYYNVLIQL